MKNLKITALLLLSFVSSMSLGRPQTPSPKEIRTYTMSDIGSEIFISMKNATCNTSNDGKDTLADSDPSPQVLGLHLVLKYLKSKDDCLRIKQYLDETKMQLKLTILEEFQPASLVYEDNCSSPYVIGLKTCDSVYVVRQQLKVREELFGEMMIENNTSYFSRHESYDVHGM